MDGILILLLFPFYSTTLHLLVTNAPTGSSSVGMAVFVEFVGFVEFTVFLAFVVFIEFVEFVAFAAILPFPDSNYVVVFK
jgi:hypothetical protein